MIAKSYEIQNKPDNYLKYNFFLFYGENNGIKKDIKEILKIELKKKDSALEVQSFYENENGKHLQLRAFRPRRSSP